MIDLFVKQIDDKYIRENFERLQEALEQFPFVNGEFQFFEFNIDKAVTNKKLYHNLGFNPNDILITRAVGSDFEFNFNSLNSKYIEITTQGELYLRCFIGNMKGKEVTGKQAISLSTGSTFTNTKSLAFDGGEHVTIGDPGLTNNFSLSGWFKTSNAANNKCIIGKYGSSASDRSFFLEIMGSSGLFRSYLYSSGGVKDYRSSQAYNDGLWHNYVITFASNNLNIFIDGTEITPTKSIDGTVNEIANTGADTKIGALPLTGSQTNGYIGNLDEIAIFNKALSPSDVTTIYNGGTPGNLEAALNSVVSWWRADGDSNPNLTDHAGNNDGTMVSMENEDISSDVPG